MAERFLQLSLMRLHQWLLLSRMRLLLFPLLTRVRVRVMLFRHRNLTMGLTLLRAIVPSMFPPTVLLPRKGRSPVRFCRMLWHPFSLLKHCLLRHRNLMRVLHRQQTRLAMNRLLQPTGH
jgi:hypothetical protein